MPILMPVTRMELWTGILSWWQCHWPDLKSTDLFRRNLFLNSLTLTLWPINSGVLSSLFFPHLSLPPHRLPAFLESLMPLKKLMLESCKMLQKQSEAFHRFLWHFFPSFKQNFIAILIYFIAILIYFISSKMSSRPDCIFEIHQLWQ